MAKATLEIQEIFLSFIISNPTLYTLVQNIYNPENFDRSLKGAAKFIQSHVENHSTMPLFTQVNAVAGTKLENIPDMNKGHDAWFLEEFETFTRREELERAIIKSADLLGKGEFDPVEKLIKDAVQISLTKDMGIDYFDNPKTRLLKLMNNNKQISTGWKDVDEKLFGGANRGEIMIFCGGSGSGKSLFLQNLALNWMNKGLHGVYITLELSEELVALRIDSMITGIGSRDIFRELDKVEFRVRQEGKKNGRLKIKYLPAQSTTNAIRSYIKELLVRENFEPDFLCVDYLDMLMPSGAKVDVSDLFTKDKLVAEEMRNIAIESGCLTASASQLGRQSYDEVEFSPSHIAGGISKMNTADVLFGIFTSRAMKERGAIQLQLMKTRNSSGVGSKIDLDFNVESLRITDSTQDNDGDILSGNSVLSKIKSNTNVVQSPQPSVRKNLLHDLLNKSKGE
jgi:archaellum biogenesis ATPase FlaH